jgi:hypothetical protein
LGSLKQPPITNFGTSQGLRGVLSHPPDIVNSSGTPHTLLHFHRAQADPYWNLASIAARHIALNHNLFSMFTSPAGTRTDIEVSRSS